MVEVKGSGKQRKPGTPKGQGEVRLLAIGEVAERSGISTSAIRFYDEHELLTSSRNEAGHRRYRADVLRRLGFIRVAQSVGLTLDQIRDALASLPDERTPNSHDWAFLARSWRPMLDERIALLESLRDKLEGCIGCGCLSLDSCQLYNPGDTASTFGNGPRWLLGDPPPA